MSSQEAITCTIEVVSPERVDAGTAMELIGRASCSPARDLRGARLRIFDGDGTVVADDIEFVEFDEEISETGPFVVTVPLEPEDYVWTAVLPRQEVDGGACQEARGTFSFTVVPHATRVVVWNAPSAIPVGEAFRVRVGIKCSAGCDQAGREFEIYDHHGAGVASGRIGDEPWPGTSGLPFAEVDLQAPITEGTFRWEARARDEAEVPRHTAGAGAFGFSVVPLPDRTVRVEVVDADKKTPIAGASVILHPFRARTDESGVVELRVPRGGYRLHISGFRYFPFRTTLEVVDDVAIEAELEWETRPEKTR